MIEKDIPVLGIEPAANIAKVAEEKGIPTLVKFFGVDTAKEVVANGTRADPSTKPHRPSRQAFTIHPTAPAADCGATRAAA